MRARFCLIGVAASGLTAASDFHALVAPEPTQEFSRALLANYPAWALASDRSAVADVAFWVDPEGRAYDCELIGSEGDARLARSVCGLIKGKRLNGARDETGVPAHGRVTTTIKFTLPDTDDGKRLAERQTPYDITVPSAFAEETGFAGDEFTAVLKHGSDGRVEICELKESASEAFLLRACALAQALDYPSGKTRKGEATAYVSSVRGSID